MFKLLCIPDVWAKTYCRFIMHPCLRVDEIPRILAHELVTSGAKGTAVALARCCRSLEDPVLHALWETQYRFLPLLKSLPGDVWKVEACRFVSLRTTIVSLLSNCRTAEDFQQNPDECGVEPPPKICSGNTITRRGRLQRPGNSGRSASITIPHRQRTFAPEADGLRVYECHQGVHSVYPPPSVPANYRYLHKIRL